MRKLVVCLCAYLIVTLPFRIASADEPNVVSDEARLVVLEKNLYKQIDFPDNSRPSFDAFARAYRGYLNLRNAGKLCTDKETLSICDMSRPSSEKRLWIIDLATKTVLFNTYVAHGQGSGEDMAVAFSNDFNSHQSSLGFYVTGQTYNGEHGLSLKLDGMDQGYNDAAFDRGIVVHGADYVSERFIAENNRLGRSWGCPAVPDKLKVPIINAIKEGTCLFIYYPEPSYLASSYWLNRKISSLPESALYPSIDMPKDKGAAKQVIYEYITNGKIDSVRTAPVK